MRRLERATAVALLITFAASTAVEAVGGREAAYVGGTTASFNEAAKEVVGRLDTTSESEMVFTATSKPFTGTTLRIPYAQIRDLEYGQKAGRRVGAAVATTVLLGPIGLLSLFSKKRKHYLTIGYADVEGRDQVAVLELGKDIVRTTLPVVAARSGREIDYQDEEARKASRGSL